MMVKLHEYNGYGLQLLLLSLHATATLAFLPVKTVPRNEFVTHPSTILFGNIDDTDVEEKRYFATCIPGLANVLSDELIDLGASNVECSGQSGVYFSNDPSSNIDIGMKSLLWVRTAHRIMELVVSTEDFDDWDIMDRDGLYEFIQQTVPIQKLLGDGKGGLLTLSVQTTLNGQIPKELCHSHYTGLTVKNAIVDIVREMRSDGIRPDVDIVDPDVPLVLVLRGNRDRRDGCQASLFRLLHSSGSLHKRGYRVDTVHKAAMKESLAAGLLLTAGYHKLIAAAKDDGLPAVLLDPMAGSGTFCLEAALIAADFAPGLVRMNFDNGESARNPHQVPPVIRWKDSDNAQWKEYVIDARNRASSGMKWMRQRNDQDQQNCVIMGNEMNDRAAQLARQNIKKAGFGDIITVDEGDCIDWDLGGNEEEEDSLARIVVPGRTIVVCNPPWGLRLDENIEESWLSLKSLFRTQCSSAEAWVLSGNKETTRYLRMKSSRKHVIKTADEDLRWIQYHIFKKKAAEKPVVNS
jgi:putative N6-adenine-specific DNA methylase